MTNNSYILKFYSAYLYLRINLFNVLLSTSFKLYQHLLEYLLYKSNTIINQYFKIIEHRNKENYKYLIND